MNFRNSFYRKVFQASNGEGSGCFLLLGQGVYLSAFFVLLFTAQNSFSMVNMRNGSYNESWTDFIDPSPDADIMIRRHYSSRSLFDGIFGFGWCTDLETKLTVTSDGIVTLTECGGGLEITYFPRNFDLKSANHTVNKIIQSLSKKQRFTKRMENDLRNQLLNNAKIRFNYANQMGLVDVAKIKSNKNTFFSKSKGVEKIDFDGRFYSRKKTDGSVERFNRRGQLVQKTNSSGKVLYLNYKGSKLAYIADKSGNRVNFIFDNTGQLSEISNGKGLKSRFIFENDNLVRVDNMWSKTYIYKYDKNHNLIRVDFPDKSNIQMTYNLERDWIRSYSNRIGCKEIFDFQLSNDDPKNHYWGSYKRKCKDGKTWIGRHEFWYKSYALSKEKFLHRVYERENKDYRDIYLHPYLGRAISVSEPLSYQGFAYFLNGLLNKKENKYYSKSGSRSGRSLSDWEQINYNYNSKTLKLVSSTTKNLNPEGKVVKTSLSTYKHNKRGQLIQVKSPSGRKLSLSYHPTGTVKKMVDSQHKTLTLEYDHTTDRPNVIRQEGVGVLKITYDNRGGIQDITSVPKRGIASSVIENFLSVVDFIGPAGEALKF